MDDKLAPGIELSALNKYIVELSAEHVTYRMPNNIIEFNRDVMKLFFDRVDIRWDVVPDHNICMQINHIHTGFMTVECVFKKDKDYSDLKILTTPKKLSERKLP